MSMTMTEMATECCRTIGAQNDTDQITAALASVKYALRKLSVKLNWAFTEESTTVTVSGVTQVSGAKRIIDVVDETNDKALRYIDKRQWNRLKLGYEPVQFAAYTVLENEVGELYIDTYGIDGDVTVRYYTDLVIPASDLLDVPVPDRYLPLVQAAANYFYLANRDAENPRTSFWKSEFQELFLEAQADHERHPDEDIAILPRDVFGQTWNPEVNWP